MTPSRTSQVTLTFQDMILALSRFWADQGCVLALPYDVERIAAFWQHVNSVFEVRWNNRLTYGDLRRAEELEFSVYDFEAASRETCRALFDLYEKEAARLLDEYQRNYRALVKGDAAVDVVAL